MGKYLQGLTKKWHGLPVWAWAVIAGLILFLAWRWYRGRNPSSSNATPASAASAVQTPDSSGGYSSPGSSGDSGGGSGSGFFPPQSDQPLSNGYSSGGYPYGFFGLGGTGLFNPFELPSTNPVDITNTQQPVTNAAGTGSVKPAAVQKTSPVTAYAATPTGKAAVTAIKASPSAGASGSAQTLLAASQGKVVKNTQAAKNIAGEATVTPKTVTPAKAPVTAKTTPAPVKTQPSGAGAVKSGTAKKNTQLIRAV